MNGDKKLCIFCGEPLINKTKEHILPQWLLKHTGDPKRQFGLGLDCKTGIERKFAANQFTSPACLKCNESYGKGLEELASPLIKRLSNREDLLASEYKTILDWFDKIRIGLWLAHRYLDENSYDINPNFHIDQRIEAKDRILLIYPCNSEKKGLSPIGTKTPIFSCMSSCIGIRINGIFCINASDDFLISSGVGFPYPKKVIQIDNQSHGIEKMKLKSNISYPPFKFNFYKPSVYVAQAKVSAKIYNKHKDIYQKIINPMYRQKNNDNLGSNIIEVQNQINFKSDNEKIYFGDINNHETVYNWQMSHQVLELQQFLQKTSVFSNSQFPKEIIRAHSVLTKRYKKQSLTSQSKKENLLKKFLIKLPKFLTAKFLILSCI